MSIRVRPRFKAISPKSQKEIEELFKVKLNEEENSYSGRVMDRYIVIRVIQEEQHYWSPQLSLSLWPNHEGSSTLIKGLYGPNPSVWLMFTFIHIAISVASLFILIIGLSNMSLGLSSMILWAIPVLALISLTMYFIAQTGQKIGREQLYDLHHFFEEHIGEKVVID